MKGSQNSTDRRILLVSDLHGSSECWTKAVRTSIQLKADLLVVAGDLTGKHAVIAKRGGSSIIYRTPDGVLGRAPSEDFDLLRRQWAAVGAYIVEESGQVEREPSTDEINALATRRLSQWLQWGGGVLSANNVRLAVIAGNDDPPPVVRLLGEQACFLDEACINWEPYTLCGFGFSNRTPYHTYREMDEATISKRLASVSPATKGDTIWVIHVPPYESGLDYAPMVDEMEDGSVELVLGRQEPVGSTAVADFIRQQEPLLVLSGHCHDSPGFAHIGPTLCVNAGSSYQTGTLHAALIVLRGSLVAGYQSIVR